MSVNFIFNWNTSEGGEKPCCIQRSYGPGDPDRYLLLDKSWLGILTVKFDWPQSYEAIAKPESKDDARIAEFSPKDV